ncbi:hypothetical protein PLANPX_5287 [Lacipirellula parvula]|uniref:Uncharacterized protein n=1 Tax=Lacipirellula parvula TaxID=2650471 RepID=A0A5K7XH11_9BACT|nr:hypothetical protein PLANPX_5287 [Lacipirellula parvula]
MRKNFTILGIAGVAILSAVSIAYLTNSPFQSPATLACAVLGAFAAIIAEQT